MEQYTFFLVFLAIMTFAKYLVFIKAKTNADIYLKPFSTHMEHGRWSTNFFQGNVKFIGRYQEKAVRLSYNVGDHGATFNLTCSVLNIQPAKKKSWFTLLQNCPHLGDGFQLNGNTVFYSKKVKYWGAPESSDIPEAEELLNRLIRKCGEVENRNLVRKR